MKPHIFYTQGRWACGYRNFGDFLKGCVKPGLVHTPNRKKAADFVEYLNAMSRTRDSVKALAAQLQRNVS